VFVVKTTENRAEASSTTSDQMYHFGMRRLFGISHALGTAQPSTHILTHVFSQPDDEVAPVAITILQMEKQGGRTWKKFLKAIGSSNLGVADPSLEARVSI
jgi:hypothetical protein